MTHTPGPWHVDDQTKAITTSKGFLLASHNVTRIAQAERLTDEHKANAHLIAAAPEMLTTLKAIIQRINGQWDYPELMAMGGLREEQEADILAFARAAIARAMGDT